MNGTSRTRTLLALGVSAAAVITTPLKAQTGGTPAVGETIKPDAGSSSTGQSNLPDIVVTAEKRSVNIQKVPLSVTAFTASDRALRGINTIQDLTNFTPGLSYSSQLDRPVIRGLARNNSIFTGDNSIATYDNDLYTTTLFLVGRDDMIVDQVEILLGPQNLYGHNAIGGLINTRSRRPTSTFGGEIREERGNYDYNKIEGTVSGPVGLVDGLSFRLSGVYESQEKGWFKNIAGEDVGGRRHDPYGELQLQYKSARDELWFMTYVNAFHGNSAGPGSVQAVPTTGPYDTSLVATGNGLIFNPNYAYSGNAVPGSVVGALPGGNPSTISNRITAINKNSNIYNRENYSFNFHWVHHFDAFDVKYVGGYTHISYGLSTSDVLLGQTSIVSYQLPTVTGLPPLTVHGDLGLTYAFRSKYWSHEIDFTSTGQDKFSWIGGLYYYHENTENPVTQTSVNQPQLNSTGTNLIAVQDIGQYIGSVLGGAPAPQQAIFNPRQAGDITYQNYQDTVESAAAFAQASYKLTDTLKLTAGLRFTHDRKKATEEARYIDFTGLGFAAPLLGALTPAVDVTPLAISTAPGKGIVSLVTFPTTGRYAGDAVRNLADSGSAITGTAAIEWTPDRDTLVYARYNRGYKAFGFTAGNVGPNPEAKNETVNDYEIGIKKTLGRNLVINLGGFYYDYRNDQVSLLSPLGASLFTQFVNIPKAVSDGIELAAIWNPVHNLNLNLTYGYNHTRIKTGCATFTTPLSTPSNSCFFDAADPNGLANGAMAAGPGPNGSVFQSVKGNPLPNSPANRVAFNGNYTFNFAPGDLVVSGTYIWRDHAYSSIFKRTQYDYAPSWHQVDLRTTWIGDHDRYEIVLYVKNLFNTAGFNSAAQGFFNAHPQGGGGPTFNAAYDLTPPRLYGAEVHFKF